MDFLFSGEAIHIPISHNMHLLDNCGGIQHEEHICFFRYVVQAILNSYWVAIFRINYLPP